MPLAAVFLDLGNTLLSERPARAAIYAAAARDEGLSVTVAEMSASMSRAHATLPRELDGAFRYSDAWFRAFQRHIFVDEFGLECSRFEALSAKLFGRFDDVRTFTLYPGARELLAALRARELRIGLISNWSERLRALLHALELESAFDFVLGSAEARMEKPEPAIFHAALRHAGVPSERCLHAGDDVERDARGALCAGIPAVLVDHDGRLGPVERALCPVVTSLGELQALLLERAA